MSCIIKDIHEHLGTEPQNWNVNGVYKIFLCYTCFQITKKYKINYEMLYYQIFLVLRLSGGIFKIYVICKINILKLLHSFIFKTCYEVLISNYFIIFFFSTGFSYAMLIVLKYQESFRA